MESDITTKTMPLGRQTLALSFLALATTILTIFFDVNEARTAIYIFKPLSTILILVIAFIALRPPSPRYKQRIIIGLIFSLVGDVLLMLPGDLFLFGLVSFLIAQLFYIAAFVSEGGWYRSLLGTLPFITIAIFLAIILWEDLGDMRIPALIYMVVIVMMAWQAFGQWRQTGENRALLAFIGAVLFVISDLSLAVNRFVSPIELSAILVLGSYYPAQWLIALSAGHEHP